MLTLTNSAKTPAFLFGGDAAKIPSTNGRLMSDVDHWKEMVARSVLDKGS